MTLLRFRRVIPQGPLLTPRGIHQEMLLTLGLIVLDELLLRPIGCDSSIHFDIAVSHPISIIFVAVLLLLEE